MRTRIKELESQVTTLRNDKYKEVKKLEDEIESLKNGSRVVVKRPVTAEVTLDYEFLKRELSMLQYYDAETLINSLLRVLKEAVNRAVYSFNPTMHYSSQNTIETIENFKDLEQEVREELEKNYTNEIKSYKHYIQTKEEIHKTLSQEFEHKFEDYRKSTIEKAEKMVQEEKDKRATSNADYLLLESTHIDLNNKYNEVLTDYITAKTTIQNLKESNAKLEERITKITTDSTTFENMLANFGYKLDKNIFKQLILKPL